MTVANISKTWTTLLIMLGIALVVFIRPATMPTNAAEPRIEKATAAFDDLLSQDELTRDRAVDSILRDRKSVIEQLIPIVDPANAKKYSEDSRIAAAYLLGELRAVEGVPVLSMSLRDQLGPFYRSAISRYDAPIFEALVKIGRPAVPAMIANIKNSDEELLRERSMDVLLHVLGGKRRLIDLLSKLNDKALAEWPRNRKAAERFQVARAWADDHYKYKEDEEPLY